MAYMEKSISLLLIAVFALFLVTVLSASVSSNIYFAEVTSIQSITNLRAGMWGVCSIGFGVETLRAHGCTDSQGGYSISARVSVATTQLGAPLQYANLSLLGSHDTGPLVCFLVSFLLVTVAFGPWLYEVFSTKRKSLNITRPTTAGLVILSCILSWVGFAFAVRLATALEEGLESYNSRQDRRESFQVSRGNAVWIGLVGSILTTLASALIVVRWRSLAKEDRSEVHHRSKSESGSDTHV